MPELPLVESKVNLLRKTWQVNVVLRKAISTKRIHRAVCDFETQFFRVVFVRNAPSEQVKEVIW